MEADNKAKAQIGPYISVLNGFDGKDKIRGIFNDGGGGPLDWEGDGGLLLQASYEGEDSVLLRSFFESQVRYSENTIFTFFVGLLALREENISKNDQFYTVLYTFCFGIFVKSAMQFCRFIVILWGGSF